jgi:hypothetical protein
LNIFIEREKDFLLIYCCGCDHEVIGLSPRNRKVAYIRSKVVRPFSRSCISGSYVPRVALLRKGSIGAAVKLLPCDHEVIG